MGLNKKEKMRVKINKQQSELMEKLFRDRLITNLFLKMVSTGNKSKLVSSDVCQVCGRCCMEFNMSCDVDCALRFLWIDERKIKPNVAPFRLPFNQGVEHNIKFKFPCSQLEFIDGKYRCKVWGKERPDFCNTYPDHIFYDCEEWDTNKAKKLLEYEGQNCPALKNVTVEDVVKMLNEVRKI